MALRRRHAVRFVGSVILLLLTTFFFVPILWLFLAPTKTDGQLLTESPFAFGSLSTLAHTFHRIVTYSGDSLLIWLKNWRSTRLVALRSRSSRRFRPATGWR